MNFIGVDIGKKINMACCLKEKPKLLEFENDKKGIRKFNTWLRNFRKPSRVVVEATGGYHYPVAWFLKDNKYDVRIINPILAKRKRIVSIRKLKSDAHDATVLAELARDNKGNPWIPSRGQIQHKILAHSYYRLMHQIIREKVRCNRFKELWQYTQDKIPEWLDNDVMDPFLSLKEHLKQLLENYPNSLIETLSTIPGVSAARASMIIAEVGSFDRFSDISKFIAFCGLDPAVYQSGGKAQTHGRLSKKGSPLIRYVLYLCAMATWQTYFRHLYDIHRSNNRTYKETLIIISRKIARIIYAVAKNNSSFSMNFT